MDRWGTEERNGHIHPPCKHIRPGCSRLRPFLPEDGLEPAVRPERLLGGTGLDLWDLVGQDQVPPHPAWTSLLAGSLERAAAAPQVSSSFALHLFTPAQVTSGSAFRVQSCTFPPCSHATGGPSSRENTSLSSGVRWGLVFRSGSGSSDGSSVLQVIKPC